MSSIDTILQKDVLDRESILRLIAVRDPEQIELIRSAANRTLLENCGNKVFYRGLVEFSNVCISDCYYCGIRKSNHGVNRYTLSEQDILEAAQWCAEQGYGSLVLQSGERTDRTFTDLVERVVKKIKECTVSPKLPDGLGITLCIGEQEPEVYRRLFAAGAHRYLLRVETTNPQLFRSIHPPQQTLESRVRCLEILKQIGFQVGTGVMIGLPGQTLEHLVDDLLFFRDRDIDMVGMGPYIVHSDTEMKQYKVSVEAQRDEILTRSLLMIALCRLVLKDVNIAATTALQTIKENGRELGLDFGANVIMPQLTPLEVRKDYLLYEDKPCVDENREQCRGCLERRIRSVGREVGFDQWGDSLHFRKKVNGPGRS